MASRIQGTFQTIKTEGAILPADLLHRLAMGDKDIDGLTTEAYHLAGTENLREAATRAWNRLQGAWEPFQAAMAKLPEAETGTSLTRERWLLILFQELGYGRLTIHRAFEIEGKSYPISHLWQNTPIHLVTFRQDLDRRTPGARGAARVSPHSLVQEFLNRSDDHLWGFVANGLTLRILRDNVSLTRQAYVEFDLAAMMEGEAYSDFFLLYILCHQSRVEIPEGKTPEHCWLEKWYNTAAQEGVRALDQLRRGVQDAINALGGGFLAHPANADLCGRLRSGDLATLDYYRQVLRQVYRLLFLFVAEDRGLLLDPTVPTEAKALYTRHYSTQRLRALAQKRRGTRHPDLYRALRLVFTGLRTGCPELALPALGSFLFSQDACPDVHDADIPNTALLAAVRHLAFAVDRNVLRPVNYRNLGSEELGSVYESLLEMHPKISIEAHAFKLDVAAGSERKTTGSYYTPSSLVNCLLDTALDPVLDEACKKPDPEQAILDLKVCDPACGSGHFLIAAAHRIAKRLAGIRAGEDEPAPHAIQHALRDVVGRCIYGVDINPMAVELCKINLWIEAIEPGKPLTFLDHHIQCGNSLLGSTPALIRQGIPDAAFKAIEGDVKAVCSQLRRENKSERQGQRRLWGAMPSVHLGNMAQTLADIDAEDDSTPEAVAEKEKHYRDLITSSGYENARFLADAWCAAFVWPKTNPRAPAVTTETIRRIEDRPQEYPEGSSIREGVRKLASQYQFFHWHLVFPDVFHLPAEGEVPQDPESGWSGGFDLVLGNPPWETLSPDAKEFFSAYDPEVRFLKKDRQEELVAKLLEDEKTAASWERYRRDLFASVSFMKSSGRYRLFAKGNLGKGDFDTYRMFVETAMQTTAPGRMAAQVVKSGIYSGANAQAIRKELFESWSIKLVLGFINTGEQWFPGVHPETRFAMYVAERTPNTDRIRAGFQIDSPEALSRSLADPLVIPVSAVLEQSPKAMAIPELASNLELPVTEKLYGSWPSLGDQEAGLPVRHYQREVDMGNDRDLFGEKPGGLPVYEGRMVSQFDYRAKAYRSGRGRAAVWEPLPFADPGKSIVPQWRLPPENIPQKLGDRVHHYRVGFCDVATPTAPRSLVAALIPPSVICGHKVPTVRFPDGWEWFYMVWLAAANSLSMDFLVRKKISLTMSLTVLDSLPFPRPRRERASTRHIFDLAIRLTCAGPEMTGYWNAMAQDGWCAEVPDGSTPPCFCDEHLRAKAKAAIDALVARDLYGLCREEFEFIADSFEALRRQEEKGHGEFLTKRLALKAYDDIELAVGELITETTQQTVLDKGQAILEVLALLHTWKVRVDRVALEIGLLLMRQDALRQQVATGGISTPRAGASTRRPRVQNMDQLLVEYAGANMLTIESTEGNQMISLGSKATTVEGIGKRQVGQEALTKAAEAVTAVAKIRETCTSNEACFEILGAENATELTIQ